jgi:hypothetical protein
MLGEHIYIKSGQHETGDIELDAGGESHTYLQCRISLFKFKTGWAQDLMPPIIIYYSHTRSRTGSRRERAGQGAAVSTHYWVSLLKFKTSPARDLIPPHVIACGQREWIMWFLVAKRKYKERE